MVFQTCCSTAAAGDAALGIPAAVVPFFVAVMFSAFVVGAGLPAVVLDDTVGHRLSWALWVERHGNFLEASVRWPCCVRADYALLHHCDTYRWDKHNGLYSKFRRQNTHNRASNNWIWDSYKL